MPVLSPGAPGVTVADSRHFTVRPSCVIQQQNGNDATQDDVGAYDFSDRLTDFTIQASMDNAMMSATIALSLGRGARSLSPLIATAPRLGSRAAIMPHNAVSLGVEVGSSVFELLYGRIDRVHVGSDRVTLTCRDFGAYLQEAALRETAIYGSAGGTPAETVMEQIFTANGWSSFQLQTVGTSGFEIFPYPVGEVGALDAVRTIAQQIGWDVRWFPGRLPGRPGGPLVRFYDPTRSRTASDAVIGRGRYDTLQGVEWGDEDVRNDWDVYYADPVTGLPVGPIHVEDAASIAFYGRRKARIYLTRAENIRDDTAAGTFAGAALTDSKDPFVGHNIRMPFYPNVTLNDLHTYEANGREYDQDLTLAVVQYTHTWSAKPNTQPKTTIGARGQPLAAYREYRSGIPPLVFATLAAPSLEYAPEGTLIMVTDSLTPP